MHSENRAKHFDNRICFSAKTPQDAPVYNTKVIIALGQKFCIMYADGITNKKEQREVLADLEDSGHETFSISWEQVIAFCRNMLEVYNQDGKPYWIISSQAYHAFFGRAESYYT
jgi:hypothetical protein